MIESRVSSSQLKELVADSKQVAEHYDPVDLFNDVAAALEDEFPGILGADVPQDEPLLSGQQPSASPLDDALADVVDPRPDGPATGVGPEAISDRTNTATVQALEHLHAAGVLSDAQFETKKAELDR